MVARTPLVMGGDGLAQQLQPGDSIPVALGYTSGSNANGTWTKRPDGKYEQSGSVTLSAGAATITFPVAFASKVETVTLTAVTSTTSAAISCYLTATPTLTSATVAGSVTTVGLNAGVTAATFTVLWRAFGT